MYYWWGMSFIWWLFWIAVVAIFFSLATPVWRSNARMYDARSTRGRLPAATADGSTSTGLTPRRGSTGPGLNTTAAWADLY